MNEPESKPKVPQPVVRRGSTRFPGIVEDAKRLGVHRVTLYRALTGRQALKGLMQRYRSLPPLDDSSCLRGERNA
jgi:hypothetical protein